MRPTELPPPPVVHVEQVSLIEIQGRRQPSQPKSTRELDPRERTRSHGRKTGPKGLVGGLCLVPLICRNSGNLTLHSPDEAKNIAND